MHFVDEVDPEESWTCPDCDRVCASVFEFDLHACEEHRADEVDHETGGDHDG